MQAEKKIKPGAKMPAGGRRIQVRESGIHGKGVYAVRPIKAGEMVLEARPTTLSTYIWMTATSSMPSTVLA
jgi:hypothetical protein